MSIFGAVMNYAIKKRYVPASRRFDERPKLNAECLACLRAVSPRSEGRQFDVLLPAYLRHAPIAGRRGRVFPRRADGNFRPHD